MLLDGQLLPGAARQLKRCQSIIHIHLLEPGFLRLLPMLQWQLCIKAFTGASRDSQMHPEIHLSNQPASFARQKTHQKKISVDLQGLSSCIDAALDCWLLYSLNGIIYVFLQCPIAPGLATIGLNSWQVVPRRCDRSSLAAVPVTRLSSARAAAIQPCQSPWQQGSSSAVSASVQDIKCDRRACSACRIREPDFHHHKGSRVSLPYCSA